MNVNAKGNAFRQGNDLPAKMMFYMKMSAFFLFAACLQVSAKTYSQKVSISGKNMSLEAVFDVVKNQTGYDVLYNPELIKKTKPVTVSVKNADLASALAICFKEQPVNFDIRYNTIVVNTKPEAKPETPENSSSPEVIAEVGPIKGVVKDADGKPLAGASVMVKGSKTGTTTNEKGEFIISVPDNASALVVSYIGMENAQVSIKGKSNLSITLDFAAIQQQDVVVVGYGTQKKANTTAAISSIKGSEIASIPAANMSQLLQGRMTGLYVQTSVGTPGATSSLRIRANSTPNAQGIVYVIDNVVRDAAAFNALDVNEVADITVLKDAAAAAIYGSRSSGGVLLVTTKTGKQGKPAFNFSTSTSTNRLGPNRELMGVAESIDLYNQIWPGAVSQEEKDWTLKINPDGMAWYHALYRNPTNSKASLNVSGATDIVNYFLGASYYKEKGYFDHVDFNKFNVRGNVDVKVSKDLTAGINMATTIDNRDQMGFSAGDPTLSTYGMMGSMRGAQALINVPVYINGKPVNPGWIGNVPEIIENGGYIHYPTNRTDLLVHLDYKVPFVKGLTAKVAYSNNTVNAYDKQYYKNTVTYNFKTTGAHNFIYTDELLGTQVYTPPSIGWQGLYSANTKTNSYQFNGQLNYDHNFGQHHVDALLVYEQYEVHSWNLWSQRKNFPLYATDQYFAASSNSADVSGSGSESEDARLSYAGRVNYNYAGKYLLSASFREDGSLKFAPNKRWGFFPSVSAGWRVSNEQFFEPAKKYVNSLKLRGSVATTGNDGIGGWQWLEQYSVGGGYLMGTGGAARYNTGLNYNGLPNANLTWESSRTWDGGIDAQFFKHFTLGADYYFRHTYDILGSRILAVPAEYGAAMPAENYAAINAKGVELELGYQNTIGKDFTYGVHGNFTYATNKWKLRDVANGTMPVDNPIGKTMSYMKGLQATGIIRTQADLDKLPAGYRINGVAPALGMMNFADINGPNKDGKPDGKIDSYDNIVLSDYSGVGSAPYTYGMSINLGWKGLTLDALFAGSAGFDYSRAQSWYAGMRLSPIYFSRGGWTPQNPNSPFPKIVDDNNAEKTSYTTTSTFNIQRGDFIRLKYLNLGYTIPAQLTNKVGVKSLQLFAQGTNLFLFTKFKDWDPEIANSNSYPMTKAFTIGLNAGF